MVAWVAGVGRSSRQKVTGVHGETDPRGAFGGEKNSFLVNNFLKSFIPDPMYDSLVDSSIFKAPNHQTVASMPANPVSEKFPLLPIENSSKGPMLSPEQVWNRIVVKFIETQRFFTENEADLENGNTGKSAMSLMSVTIRKPFTAIKSLALLYSFLPFVLIALMIVVDVTTIAPLSLYATVSRIRFGKCATRSQNVIYDTHKYGQISLAQNKVN